MGLAEITTEQQKLTYTPYVRVEAVDYYTYATDDSTQRIISVEQIRQPYFEEVKIVLNNDDQALTDLDFRGKQVNLGFGFIIGGSPDYIAQPYLKVISQEFDSRPGFTTLTLICSGIVSLLELDRASKELVPADGVDPSVILANILESSYNSFSHCDSYTLDWTAITKASDIDFYYPGGGFRVGINATRLSIVRRILDNSYIFMLPQSDGTIDFIRPTISGVVYDYEYELAGDHDFLTKADIQSVLNPSMVTVYGGTYDDDTETYEYSGSAGSGNSIFIHFETITSDGMCDALAAAVLAAIQVNSKSCVVTVPMNCFAELLDYCKITDSREGSSVTGNIGYIKRTYKSGKDGGSFSMQIRFGGWMSDRSWGDLLTTIRRPITETQSKLITISIPEIAMPVDEVAYMQVMSLPNGRELMVYAYGVYAYVSEENEPVIKLAVEYIGDEGNTRVWSVEADTYKKFYYEKRIYGNSSGEDQAVIIMLSNEGEIDANVTAFLTFRIS